MSDIPADRSPAVLVPRFILDAHRSELGSAAGSRARFVADDDRRLTGTMPAELEVVVTGVAAELLVRAVTEAPIRWVHSVSAGVDHLPLEAMAERGILLTSSAGAYASAMAEYALAGMIMLSRNLPGWLDGQRAGRWLDADTFDGSLIRGKRLGIVGYGAVGRELAAAARACGMEVWATKRTPLFPSGEPLDRLLTPDRLGELLSGSDVVVLCASLNRTTRHLIGPAELATMKPTALLVNVARGALVDEAALDRALRSGRLRGAMLDVTEREPLPEDSPLWTTPNLLLTPHVSGDTRESWTAVIAFLCRNLELYLAGEAGRMGNLVDYGAVR